VAIRAVIFDIGGVEQAVADLDRCLGTFAAR
jgi:hypothetical protein